ncbi:hypothetical protein B0H67DRAFT_562735 [Lasiosphaeris hirsuta]|uniref:Uncharacterized protein n=1 Tax=Lasiosphaeris hirsuta TaxID=260670 RepID=A0AA40ECW6_9PEZI|nr:hypothetical protein B0H67DRAFT_562735 [Lasiosphaeris hirsuta]
MCLSIHPSNQLVIAQPPDIDKPKFKHNTQTFKIMSNPGYSDEVAEECHDLIDRAEEEAHLHDDDTIGMSSNKSTGSKMKNKVGLESESSEGRSMTENKQSGSSGMKESMGKKMDQM